MGELSLIEILYQNREMRSEDEVHNFVDALNKLKILPQKKEELVGLFLIFSNKTEHIEVMWAVVHLAEQYETKVYISTLVSVTPSMLNTAIDWLRILYSRILNNHETRMELISVVRRSSKTTQTAIEKVLPEQLNWAAKDE